MLAVFDPPTPDMCAGHPRPLTSTQHAPVPPPPLHYVAGTRRRRRRRPPAVAPRGLSPLRDRACFPCGATAWRRSTSLRATLPSRSGTMCR